MKHKANRAERLPQVIVWVIWCGMFQVLKAKNAKSHNFIYLYWKKKYTAVNKSLCTAFHILLSQSPILPFTIAYVCLCGKLITSAICLTFKSIQWIGGGVDLWETFIVKYLQGVFFSMNSNSTKRNGKLNQLIRMNRSVYWINRTVGAASQSHWTKSIIWACDLFQM